MRWLSAGPVIGEDNHEQGDRGLGRKVESQDSGVRWKGLSDHSVEERDRSA